MGLKRRLDWKSAATFPVADPDWRQKIWIGGLWMLFPPIGWPVALGYRKSLIPRLNGRVQPVLPTWKGELGHYWLEGMKAVGVMTAYFAPIYAFLAVKAWTVGLPVLPWGPLAALFAFAFFLSPFLGPVLVLLSSFLVGADTFSELEVVGVLAYYGCAVLVLPAGYLQVSRRGTFWAAFDLRSAFGLIKSAPREYAEAWVYSGLTSLIGHFVLPLAPWGVFWCYQSIIYSFNEVRLHTGDPLDADLVRGPSWFLEFQEAPGSKGFWEDYETEAEGMCERYTPAADGLGEPFSVIRLGEIRAPLPRALEQGVARWKSS